MPGLRSIKAKLAAALILVMVVCFLIHHLAVSPRLERRRIDDEAAAQLALAGHAASVLDNALAGAVEELKSLAALPALRSPDPAVMNAAIETANAANHFFNYFFVMDRQGRWLSYPTQPQLVGETIPSGNMHWVSATFAGGDVTFLDVVKSRLGTLVSGFSVPIGGAGGATTLLRGVCVISECTTLVKTLDGTRIGRGGHGFLVAANGWLIAHPHKHLNYGDFNAYDMTALPPVRDALAGRKGIVRYTAEGIDWIAAYAPVPTSGWALVIQQPYADVVAGAERDVRTTTAYILVSFAVGLLIVAGVVALALRPLYRLIAHVESGAAPSEMETSGDEIGRLAGHFKRLYDDLYRVHQRFLTVLDGIDATIYVADMNTHEILFMNRYMIERYGRDMTGEPCYRAFRQMASPCPHCTNEKLLGEDGKPAGLVTWQGENPVTGRYYINYDRAIGWIDGRVVRIQIATDITEIKTLEKERKEYEKRLEQAQKMESLGTLAGGIAHDFNNLLMGIQGRASLMLLDLAPAHPFHDHLRGIEEYVRSAADLTRQLLGFARGGKYEVKPVDLGEVVAESAALFARTRKEIRIHVASEVSLPAVAADRRQIEQVLLNLFVNAWQAMPEGGDLFLETRAVALGEEACRPHRIAPGRFVKASVTDTGIGMSKNILPRIFDPFFTTKEKGRGTGLGLASAYGIVTNHGGIITVYSEEGNGTTFNIYLPVTDAAAEAEPAPVHTLQRGTETLLLVDDEAMILEVGRSMLASLGYTVVTAQGGEAAVAEAARRAGGLDLAILDLVMPGMDGGKTFDRLRETVPGLKVLLSSGYAINGQAEAVMKRGCAGFIQKPFSIQELSEKIRSILDGRP